MTYVRFTSITILSHGLITFLYHFLPFPRCIFGFSVYPFFIFPMWHFSSCEYFSTLDYSGYQSILCHGHYFTPQKDRLHRESFHSLKSTQVAVDIDIKDAAWLIPYERYLQPTNSPSTEQIYQIKINARVYSNIESQLIYKTEIPQQRILALSTLAARPHHKESNSSTKMRSAALQTSSPISAISATVIVTSSSTSRSP